MAETESRRRWRSKYLLSGLIISVVISAVLAFAPIFPHTLYCFDEPIPPPYRESYLTYSTEGPGSTESFGITTVVVLGRAWLRFWPWLTDEDDINDNVFFKAAWAVAHYEVEAAGKAYPPPAKGLAYVQERREKGLPIWFHDCDLAAIGARDVPPGTPWR